MFELMITRLSSHAVSFPKVYPMVVEKSATKEQLTTPVLPLESGDRLTRPEFERRYQAMPQIKKAELIEGVVYVPSPVRFTRHARPHAFMVTWMTSAYSRKK